MSVPTAIFDQVFTRQLFAFAGFTLLFYDYFLTFSLEVTHIWSAPWTVVKILFLINRYGNLVGQVFIMLEETGHLSRGSQRFCTAFQLFCPFFAVFSGESIRLLIVMRACAIRGCKQRIAIMFNTMYVIYGIAVLAAATYMLTAVHPLFFEYLEEIGICFIPVGPDVWACWLVSICLDTFVFAIVSYSLCQFGRGCRGIYHSRLIRLLARDALLFYGAALFNSVFCIACWTVYRMDPRNFIQTVISFPLLSVVGQRIVLNLRRLRTRPDSTRDISLEVNRQMAAIGDGPSLLTTSFSLPFSFASPSPYPPSPVTSLPPSPPPPTPIRSLSLPPSSPPSRSHSTPQLDQLGIELDDLRERSDGAV